MYLSVKCLFDDGSGPVQRDFVINLNDIDAYFDWVPGQYTAVHVRGTKRGDFPNWHHVAMPFAEFDKAFKAAIANETSQPKPPSSGLPVL